ncbi:MAG: CPBP family intramembrane metalloprotease, partial [Thermoleophilia bacterium]|nr:CPBP family intramembrane metalloprotease [Thermoleophilia bacterium]
TQLRIFAERLHATQNPVLLFYQVCFISAPVEEAFFRGVIFEEKGSSAAAGFYAASAFLFYAPHVPILVALLVTLAMALLGVVYGHVRERYGLVAAIASHVVAGFTLQVLPSWLDALRTLLI